MTAACGNKAEIAAVIESAPESDVIVKRLDINRYETLDTLKTDASGKFTYSVKIEKGQPQFIYLFHKDVKLASLLLDRGDKVNVEADTLGNYTVSGTPDSEKLAQIEKDFAAAQARMFSLAEGLAEVEPSSEKAGLIRNELWQEYLKYYRSRVKYVLENRGSLTVIPVFFQNLGENLPVFSQSSDAIHFTDACDTLELLYPESEYVKSLRAEADKRVKAMELEHRIAGATQVGYPDVTLPDLKGTKQTLSEVDAKVVLVHFWSSSDPVQTMFNLDVLSPVYEDYRDKGFEIYQVSLDVDKTRWANVVRAQNLPWINVCDAKGNASQYVATYNLSKLPVSYLISNDALVDVRISDEKSLRKALDKILK